MADTHKTVLLSETVEGLNLQKKNTAIDATVGVGGHAEKIANKIGRGGILLAIDADELSLALAKERLKDSDATIVFVQGNFRNISELAKEAGIMKAHGIVFDLGWHAEQLA